jgi:hypothetical protein
MRILRPSAGIFAFYDGRIAGYRYAEGPNWVDDGALFHCATRSSASPSRCLLGPIPVGTVSRDARR